MNLLAMHFHAATGGQPKDCTCPRAACGGAEQGPGVPSTGCAAHGTITVTHHRAFDCPSLPVDADLSRLWLIVTTWTNEGPLLDHAEPFTRAALSALRKSSALWDVSEGSTVGEAVTIWQDRIDAMRAEAARRQAVQVAEAQERARVRQEAFAALRRTPQRSARRMLADTESDTTSSTPRQHFLHPGEAEAL
ncbi:hypothetical protein [Streptomyces sp. NPDC059455]|uniref:hypothetical protein n=1 Tax=Streptomyces sp. NPDC059455 TaxID=3346837 RepID=UPI00369CDF1A